MLLTGPLVSCIAPRLARANVARQALRPRLTRTFRPAVQRGMATAGCGSRIVMAGLVEDIQKKNSENPVIVYSKTWCPYCQQVKGLFQKMGVAAKVIELDQIQDGDAVQDTLSTITGRRTVPQVFIGGSFVGGCDDTMAANSSGKLKQLFADAGVAVTG